MFYVYVLESGSTTARKIDGEVFTIGRAEDQDLTIADATLSRRHLVIRQRGAEVFVEDLNSSNGTFVNGERIAAGAPIGLDPEDVVTMGESTIQLTATTEIPTEIVPPVESRPARTAPASKESNATTRMQVAELPPRSISPPDAPASIWPRFAVGAAVGLAATLGFSAYQRSRPTRGATTPARRVATATVRSAETTYKASYVDNVLTTSRFVSIYLSDEFQSRLTRDVAPAATRQLRVPPAAVIQALGVTAELVKSLGDVNDQDATAVEKLEIMRRLETDANAHLLELLGSPNRVAALRDLEKAQFER